jgi:hemerythrin-like domain-containing protein
MKALGSMTREHEAIRGMVARLEREVDEAVDREELDGEAFERLLSFFEEQVDGHHEEKEERVFLPRPVTRARGEDAVLARALLEDHAEERKLLALMRDNVEAAAYGEPNSLAVLLRCARAYAKHLCAHADWEERVLFPLASKVLFPRDDRAMLSGFLRLDRAWGTSVWGAARSLALWLDQRKCEGLARGPSVHVTIVAVRRPSGAAQPLALPSASRTSSSIFSSSTSSPGEPSQWYRMMPLASTRNRFG